MKVKIISDPKLKLNVDNIFWSSDFHMNHDIVIKHGRKFNSILEMNKVIVYNINERVEENDLLTLKLLSDIEEEKEFAEDDGKSVVSHVSSAVTKNTSVVGYNRVSQKMLNDNCEYIKEYYSNSITFSLL